MNHLDISGIGHSGKSAVSDFIRELDGFHIANNDFEFDLLRLPGGILDLKKAIFDEWSLIRSNHAYKEFKNLIRRLGYKAKLYDFKRLWYSTGFNYEVELNPDFIEISMNYLKSLSIHNEKVSNSLEISSPVKVNLNRFLKLFKGPFFEKTDQYLLPKDLFLEKTRNYLDKLLININDPTKKFDFYVSHNAFDHGSIDSCIELFHNAYSIVVIRDPRDIYASMYLDNKNRYMTSFDQKKNYWSHKSSFLMTNDINAFILRQKILNKQIRGISNKKTLIVWYEDLVLHSDLTQQKIAKFLDIEIKSKHINKLKYFIPKESKKNIFNWKNLDEEKKSLFNANLKEYFYEPDKS